jgi:hypothetical protein
VRDDGIDHLKEAYGIWGTVWYGFRYLAN